MHKTHFLDYLDPFKIAENNIDAHDIKREYLSGKASISKYELCGCKDKTVVIRSKGCKGAVTNTWARLK